MPIYEYRCEDCGMIFSLQLSMSEHQQESPLCPECKGGRIVQRYSPFYAKTAKKS